MRSRDDVVWRLRGILSTLSVAAAMFAPLGGAVVAQEQRVDSDHRFADVAGLVNVAAASLASVDLNRLHGGVVRTTLPVQGVLQTIELVPHSVRSDRFFVKVQNADGSYVDAAPPPVRTMLGTVVEIEGSRVAASITDDGMHARIILPDGREVWAEPLSPRDARFGAREHAVYLGRDVIPSGGTCVALSAHDGEANAHEVGIGGGGAASSAESVFVTELAIDADVEFFQDFGTVDAAVAHIESVINSMNLQYVTELSIRHEIATIIVRTAEPDPYSSSDAGTLLGQVRSHWRSSQAGVQRDVVQMFTGKNMIGSTIGIAWLSAICSSNFGYSVVQPNCCSSFGCKTDLSSHELGHNWSANHCACSGWTMNSGLQCANRFHPSSSIPEMTSFRNSRSCLQLAAGSGCATVTPPLAETIVVPKNRYFSFSSSNPGVFSAIRVTLVDLPAPFDLANNTSMWLDVPETMTEVPGQTDPATAPGAATFQRSTLQCAPGYADWGSLGTVHVTGEFVVPGGRYLVQEVDAFCSSGAAESSFSSPLNVTTATVWGDVVSTCETDPCGPPDGTVGVPTDVVSILDKFVSSPGAPSKVRVDLQPATPDGIIDIQDVSRALDAFRGAGYPFVPSSPPCS